MNQQNSKENVSVPFMTNGEMTQELSHAIESKQHIIQNFLLIWLNENIDKSTVDYQNALTKLQSIVHIVHVFTERNEAIDFLTELDAIKVFLLIEGNMDQHLLPLIHDIPQLDVIYILFDDIFQYDQCEEKWIKIKGKYTNIQPLCDALQQAIEQCNQDSIAMSFVTVDQEPSQLNLNRLEPTFMYTQLFKETILEMEFNEQSIKHLATHCRKFYEKNIRQMNIIHEFEDNYRSKSPIWWYTRQCFIYQMLNRALRTLEGDTIVNMGFFLRDLHKQIEELYQNQVSTYGGQPFTVYRGQGLFVKDFEKLQKNIGGLMSFNNFLSTSTNQDVSIRFTREPLTKTDMVGVRFHMTINPSISSAPFASIREHSYYRKEEEILFSMHTVFRVDAITKIDDNMELYQVDLRLTADDDQELRTLTAAIRKDVAAATGWTRLAALLRQIQQFDMAEEVYIALLEQASHENEQALCFNQLGYIKDHQGDHTKAMEYHKKALEIREKTLPPNNPWLAASYNNISRIYDNMGEYSKAFSFIEKAVEIFQKTLPSNHPHLAASYINIGTAYDNIGEYSKALPFLEKALEIYQKTLPSNHPLLATSYNNISRVYMNMGEHSKAFSFLEKALEIFEKTLPPNHPDLVLSYNNIAWAYSDIGEYSKAVSFYEKALEIRQKALPPNHSDLATSYNNIAMAYGNMGEYSKALPFLEKALEIYQKTLPPNHPDLATFYNNIGVAYKNIREYPKALSFFEKALEIYQKTLPPNHSDLAASYNNIGFAYDNIREYSKAVSFYEKALEIYQKTLPPNHPSLATSYNNIAMAYDNMGEYSKAVSFYEKALEIRQKTLPPNHSDLAASYNNIGVAYKNIKEYPKAVSFSEKALEIFQKTLPPNHPDLATSYNNIGVAYKNIREYPKALLFLEKALEIRQKTLPPNHSDLAASYNNIGLAYDSIGEYSKAVSFYEKALEIYQKTLPPNHPHPQTLRNNIEDIKRRIS